MTVVVWPTRTVVEYGIIQFFPREMRTWAYGKKIIFIRIVYWLLAASVFFALWSLVQSGAATRTSARMRVSKFTSRQNRWPRLFC